jgi:hypothetical protein
MDEVDAEREGESWRVFSEFDMMRLSITKNLVDFGVPVSLSALWAMAVFQDDAHLQQIHGVSKKEFVRRLINRTIYVWRYDDDWRHSFDKKDLKSSANAFLTVNVSSIVRDVFDRLDHMSNTS